MGSEKVDKKEKKKDGKEKKEKHSETDGVKKSKKEKKDKREKKEKKKKSKEVEQDLQIVAAPMHDDSESGEELDAMDLDLVIRAAGAPPPEALVPFARPLADTEQTKDLRRAVKKASKNKTLKRGVKEVQKALRKTSTNQPSSSYNTNPIGVIIMAADISPMDVISHLPVLCEDFNIPYIYVSSRAELGIAGNTKRATSVVLLLKERSKSKRKKAEGSEGEAVGPEDPEWASTYAAVVKMVLAAGKTVLR